MRLGFLFIVWMLLVTSGEVSATIINTKHNLSISNSAGAIKAQTETEVCVFCHIPHVSRPEGKPLWNRSMQESTYTMYDSDYLRRTGYPEVALDLGKANDTPGALSRQCLSCHDGTVAVGAVFKLRRTLMGTNTIDMSGVAGDGSIPTTAAGFLGTDLRMHHPVGIEYDPNVIKNFGSGSRTIELKTIPDAPLKLFEYGGLKYVECSSCHDPHIENNKFLRFNTGANHAQNVVGTCTACHDKLNWTGSIHQTSTATYTDPAVSALYGSNRVSDLGCINCHKPHNAEGTPYLTVKVQANTCFQGASTDIAGAACHDTGGAKDIKTVLGRLVSHPVIADSDPLLPTKHTNLDTLYGTNVSDPSGAKGIAWDTNMHAVCVDCHNPHQAKAGTHAPAGQLYPDPGMLTNAVSNALQGVPGVEPSWPTEWTQPTTFTTMESATKEYQICLKCHSYWGLGSATGGVNDGGYVSAVTMIPLTDVAWEMNKYNKSGHPVVIDAFSRIGSTLPKELDPSQLVSPWDTTPGANTMYCSDCHGADDEVGGDPKGPHGSGLTYMLKGVNQYWPTKIDGTLYATNDIGTGGDAGLFCKNCHDLTVPHKKWVTKMSGKNFQCVECHVAVPHGSPVSRLLGYSNFPSPYNYNGNSLKPIGFRKNAVTLFSVDDIWAGTACSSGGGANGTGGGCHVNNAGGYDANPYTAPIP